MTTIARIDVTHHELPLDPPFPAAWDPTPRAAFPATVVRVYDTDGRMGIGSGDAMHGIGDYLHLFVGQDPTRIERHGEVLAAIDFHAGRPWPLEAALWDLLGAIESRPIWQMLGGGTGRIRAYASSGALRPPAAMASLAASVAELGFPALKIRFGRPDLADDLAAVEAVRAAVGSQLELMVDCNQGWRMPGDTSPPWDVERATGVARHLEALGVSWMEEPLHRGDYEGMRRLRAATGVRIAGGEMTRQLHEFEALMANGCLDVYQPDAVLTTGIGALAGLARRVVERGLVFTPHTWGNGIGLAANLHLAAGVATPPFVEFPYDPPEWTAERRDFMMTRPIQPDDEGWLDLTGAPGLGVELDEDVLAATETGRWSRP